METQEKVHEKLTIPGAIVTAGIVIALAVLYTGGKKSTSPLAGQNDNQVNKQEQQAKQIESIKPVTSDDHILGNPNAPVKIVEFSDIECPFCKRFHPVLQKIMDDFGKDGKVAWVYRHFPLSIHQKATPEAIATECVNEQGGNDIFWKYLGQLFAESLSNNQTPDTLPAEIAKKLGVDILKFNECVTSGRYDAKIQAHIEDGISAGVSGTPYSIVIAKNGKKFPLNGSLPYDNVRTIVELALKESK